MTAMRPAFMTSNGGACTLAPSSAAFAAVASASATVMYEFHAGGTPASRCCWGWGEIAPTHRPSSAAIEYITPSPAGMSLISHPNRPE